ncbi:MAG: NADH dehydrogenase [Deltaproteobacteria bacterium 13_1_20CM_2_69_21]|nr:MAG: NADH dehydrogenase [Deltaproteobacteria bacterium 13_1_20CM_2_69_21]
MDLRQLEAEPTEDEREAIDARLGSHPQREGTHFAAGLRRDRRHLLLPALQAAQARVGWISEGVLAYICKRLDVPPADAWGVATFYGLLSMEPRPRRVLHVCDDIACRCSGANELIAELERTLGVGDGAAWQRSPCLGLCDQAPAAFLTVAGPAPAERLFGPVTAEQARAVLAPEGTLPAMRRPRPPQAGDPSLRLLERVGIVDPGSLDEYQAHGGYQALARAFEMGPERVIREVLDSKLMGRGGAAFPMGRKWDAVARQPVRPHYLICNADESEPGTFKDRVLMEGDPFAVVESMTICAYATGCEKGYVYARGEYPLAFERLQGAIEAARARGLLGADVMGHGVRFDIEIRRGAGAYICGEETAIFNSIEGFRGEPRNKPPFPVEVGLFGKPTVVNNVETLVNVLGIVREGGAAYARIGTPQSTGPKLFCVSGHVVRPGVYEVEFGATLRDLLALAGGVAGGRKAQAILLGGAAGVFVRGDELDIALTFEEARAAQVTLGSGVVMVFDDSVDLTSILLRIAAFFRDESCGQCVPCRVGTVRQEEALHRIVTGRPHGSTGAELALLDEIGRAMKDASICGLGQTAYGAVESAARRLKLFEKGKVG